MDCREARSNTWGRWLAALAWPCVAGCPGGTPDDDGGGSGTGTTVAETTEDPGMTGPMPTGTTDAMETTLGTTLGTTMGTTDDPTAASVDDTSTGEPVACEDQPARGVACVEPGSTMVQWQVRIDGVELSEQDVAEACTVLDLTDDGVTTTIVLDCAAFEAEVELTTVDPHHVPALAMGDPVELRASAQFEDEAVVARYLTLHRAGLALGAFDGSRFMPPPSFDFEPLAIEVVASDCTPFFTECVRAQRAALQVGHDGQTELVFSRHAALVGQLTGYHVLTGDVERIHCFPDDCGYNYAEWFVQGVVIRVPEG